MSEIQRKQYVFSSGSLNLPDMVLHKLENGYLYTHPQLNVVEAVSKNNKHIWILGNAFCMDAEKTVQEDVAAWEGEDLASLTRYWTGRWVLICEGTLITDACGLMAAFYKSTQDGWIVSSSLAVLATVCGVKQTEMCERMGLNWQLLPKTLADGISKLCSTQKLDYSTSSLQVLPHLWQEDCTGATTEEKSEELSRLLTMGCKNIAATGKQIYLALTAGKDSRLVFSALLHAGVPFETYTSAYPQIRYMDKTLPATMSKAMGVRHSYIKRKKHDSQKESRYTKFTFGDTNGMDAVFYAHGQFEQLSEDGFVIRSGLFEAGQSYGRTIAGNTPETFESGIRSYYASAFQKKRQNDAFEKWLQWVKENPIPFIDIRDRFYIEQRVGGWAAAIEQSLDLNDFTSIQIANCPRLLSVLLSATDAERKAVAIAMQSMQRMQPKLMQYPINKVTLWDKMIFVLAVVKNPVKKFRNWTTRRRRK